MAKKTTKKKKTRKPGDPLMQTSFRASVGNEMLLPDLELMALKENRTLNNYVECILLAHRENNKPPSQLRAYRT